MLQFICSRNNEQAEEAVFSAALESFRAGEAVYLLVPEQYTLQTEVKLMERVAQEAVAGVRVMSFQHLALEALGKVGGLKRVHIDHLGKSMVLRRILMQEQLPVYARAQHTDGFVTAMLSQIAEFKRSRILPEQLMLGEQVHPQLAQKLSVLASVYNEMEQVLGKEYVDNEDRLGQLAELTDLSYLKDVKFFVYGFLDFTQLELEILSHLMKAQVALTIGLCLDPEYEHARRESIFAVTHETQKKLIALAQAAGQEAVTRDIGEVAAGGPLAHLGRELFCTLGSVYPDTDAEAQLRLMAAHSIDEELHWIARDIKRQVAKHGARYRDFMIVSADPQRYHTRMKQVMSQYDIPVFIDEKRGIMNTPIVKTILACLNLMGEAFRTEDMMVFLKNGFSGVSQEDVCLFENDMLRRGLKGEMFFEDRYFECKEDASDRVKRDFERVRSVRARLVALFGASHSTRSGVHRVELLAQELLDILEQTQMFREIQRLIGELNQSNLLEEASENNQVWNIVVRVLEQAVQLFGDTMLTRSQFRSIIQAALQQHRLAVIPPAIDQVIAGDLARSRSARTLHVYLCGANAGVLPRSFAEQSLLSQEDKQLLREQGLGLPSIKEQVMLQEQLALYILLTGARETLSISYSTQDGALPAMLIGQVRELFPSLTIHSISEQEGIPISMPTPTIARAAQQMRRNGSIEAQAILRYYAAEPRTAQMVQWAESALCYSSRREKLKDARTAYPLPLALSTTRLQSFAQCPYKHFVRYGLRAEERKRYEIESAAFGIVLHETMEQFTQRLRQEAPRLEQLAKAEAERWIDEIFDRVAQRMLTDREIKEKRSAFLLQRERETARRAGLLALAWHRGDGFTLAAQEAGFGREGEPRLTIQVDGVEAALIGTIDRIDVLERDGRKYIKIIDYKTREKAFSLSEAYHGVDIQLLLYLYAALYAMEHPDAIVLPAGAFYFPVVNKMTETAVRSTEELEALKQKEIKVDGIIIDDAEIAGRLDGQKKGKKNVFTAREIERLLAHMMETITDQTRRMQRGEIDVRPILSAQNQQVSACTYCNYGAICGFDPISGDRYRYLPAYKEDEIKVRLMERESNEQQSEEGGAR